MVRRSTEPEIKVCRSCTAGPGQGQTKQFSKRRKKTFHKPLFQALYKCPGKELVLASSQDRHWHSVNISQLPVRTEESTLRDHKIRKSCPSLGTPQVLTPTSSFLIRMTSPSLRRRNLHSPPSLLPSLPSFLFWGWSPESTWVSSRITTVSGFNGIGFKRH